MLGIGLNLMQLPLKELSLSRTCSNSSQGNSFAGVLTTIGLPEAASTFMRYLPPCKKLEKPDLSGNRHDREWKAILIFKKEEKLIMKIRTIILLWVAFSYTVLCLGSPTLCSADGYASLKGVDSVKILFDFRDGNPISAPVHIKLIQETFNDKALNAITSKPKFVVVFSDKSVKLLSTRREGVSPEEAKVGDEMAALISEMSKAGIKFEVCLFAVKFFGGDPNALVKGIDHVDNGWVSAFGYQANGYALIPAY